VDAGAPDAFAVGITRHAPDPTVLAELKERQRREGKSLGRLVSELLAERLGADVPPPPEPFAWRARRFKEIEVRDPFD